MNLNTKLKMLVVGSVAGTLATTMSLVLIPVIEEGKYAAIAATVSVVGVIVAVGCLKEVHRIDVELNKGEL